MREVARHLPPDLPAAIFLAIHTSVSSPGVLPLLLNHSGPLRASYAREGELIHRGHIYIAPADHHLLLRDGITVVSHGPRENGFRDPFRLR